MIKKGAIFLLTILITAIPFSELIADSPRVMTKVSVHLHETVLNAKIGSIDITIDYDQKCFSFMNVSPGTVSKGAHVIANNNGDTVRAGLIHPHGFGSKSKGSIIEMTFKENDLGSSVKGKFRVKRFLATDLSGVKLDFNVSKVSLDVAKYVPQSEE